MKNIQPYAKAIAGFVFGAVTAYLYSKQGGVNGDEWLQIIISALAGSGLIYVVPNKDPKALHQQESVQPPERGQVDVSFLLLVLTFVGVLLLLFRVHLGG